MEFKTVKTDVDKIGDIESNEVSIDVKNINFITTILSTNLYSNPVSSFVREIVSNAWDSHVEAGIDEPVILEIGEDTEGNYYCRIQDFGVGLSEERFNDIYKNIGSSTKRDSNEQIGGFGIGRFSALAVSDIVHITSIYNGKIYKYLMYKDGMKIVIDKLFEDITDERNGVEVRVPIENDNMLYQFSNAIQEQLVYFENVYFVNNVKDKLNTLEEKFNNYKIKTYKHFKVNNMFFGSIDLILGKVRYPLRLENLNKTYTQYQQYLPISIVFDIGDLEVSPTREEILYSKANIKTIEDKLELAFDEVREIIKKNTNKDFDRFYDYLLQIKEPNKITLLHSSYRGLNDVNVKGATKDRNYTLNGVKYDETEFIRIHSFITSYKGLNTNYIFDNDNTRIKYERKLFSLDTIKSNIDNCYLADLGSVKNITKTYIRSEFYNNSYFFNYGKDTDLKKIFKEYKDNYIRSNLGSNEKFNYRIFKFIFFHFVKNVSKLKHINDDVIPKQWILDYKAEQKAKREKSKRNIIDRNKEIYLHVLRNSFKGDSIVTDSQLFKIDEIVNNHCVIIYADKNNDEFKKWYDIFGDFTHYKMVQVSPTYLKVLENIDNCIKFEEFMDTKQKLIRNIGTAMYILDKVPYIMDLASIRNLDKISEKLDKTVYELSSHINKQMNRFYSGRERNNLYQEIYEMCKETGYFNFNIKGLVDENQKLLENAKVLIAMANDNYAGREIPEERLPFVVDYILSRKLFRPKYQIALESKKLINNK